MLQGLTDCVTPSIHTGQEVGGAGAKPHGQVALPAASPAQLPSLPPLHDSPGLTHPIWGLHSQGSRGTSPHLTDKGSEDPGRGCGWPRAPAPGSSHGGGHWGRGGPRPRAPPLPPQGAPLQEHRVPPCLCGAEPTRQASEPLWTEGVAPRAQLRVREWTGEAGLAVCSREGNGLDPRTKRTL